MKVFAKTLVALSAVALSPMALAYNALDHGSSAVVSESVNSREAVRAQAIAALDDRKAVSGENKPYIAQVSEPSRDDRGAMFAGTASMQADAWLPHTQRDIKSS